MSKEKTLKIDKQTVIIICISVLLVVGFLVWNNINKREVEFQRDKMEQEKLLEEQKLNQEKRIIEEERAAEFVKEGLEKAEQEYARTKFLECVVQMAENNPRATEYQVEMLNKLCKEKAGYKGTTDL